MIAARTRQAFIEQRTCDTQAEELEYLARLISQQIECGKTPDQIAVLTRTNKEATTIALSLAAAGIACYHPDNDVLSFREVRALIAWTRVALDENDRLALVLAMSTPDCGLTAAAIDMFVDRSEERRVGKDVSVRVDLGGRRNIKKKKKINTRKATNDIKNDEDTI